MRRTGFVYTLFALLMLALTLNITLLPLTIDRPSGTGEKMRVDEVFYFLESVNSDFDRVTGIIGRRAMTALDNRIVNNGSYLNDSKDAFREAFKNGTINNTPAALMERSSFLDWSESMESESGKSGYNLSIRLVTLDLGSEPPVTILLNSSYRYNLSDEISNSRFERSRNVSRKISFEGVEDPLILVESAGRYTNIFSSCQDAGPAERLSTGGDWFYSEVKNWTSGKTIGRPGNGPVSGVSSKNEKIAVVNDLCSYTDLSDFSGFRGVVSESDAIDDKRPNNAVDVCGEDNVNIDAVLDDSTDATSIENGSMAVMTEDELWQNNLYNRTNSGCYFSDPWAPTVWGRMEGRMSNPPGKIGTAFILTVTDLPSELQEEDESAVAYVYFNETGDFGDVHKVKGVTDHHDWFRLDQKHVDEWGINALTYD